MKSVYLLCIALMVGCGPIAIGQTVIAPAQTTATFLARELPQALKDSDLRHLDHYFTDDVELKINVEQMEPIKGKNWVLLALSGRRKPWTTNINGVIASNNSVAVVQNISARENADPNLMAPRVDIFHINSEGKIFLVETTLGDRNRSNWESC